MSEETRRYGGFASVPYVGAVEEEKAEVKEEEVKKPSSGKGRKKAKQEKEEDASDE